MKAFRKKLLVVVVLSFVVAFYSFAGNTMSNVITMTAVGGTNAGETAVTFTYSGGGSPAEFLYEIAVNDLGTIYDDRNTSGLDTITPGQSVVVGEDKYLYVYSMESNTVTGFGKIQILAEHISQSVATISISVEPGVTPGSTILSLSSVPGSPESIRYSVTGSSATPPTNVTPESAGLSLLVSGETEIAVQADQYIQVYSHQASKVTGFGEFMPSITDIKEYPPVTTTFNVVNNAYGFNPEGDIVVTFSEPVRKIGTAPMDAAYFAANIIFKELGDANTPVPFTTTMNAGASEFTINPDATLINGKKYIFEVNGQYESLNAAAYHGETIGFTVGEDMNWMVVNESNKFKFRYTGQYVGKYYFMLVKGNSGAIRPTNKETTKTIVDTYMSDGAPNYICHRFDTTADGVTRDIDLYIEPRANYDLYVIFEDSNGFIFDHLRYLTFNTPKFIQRIQNVSCADDPGTDVKTKITLPAPASGNSFVYKLSVDENPVVMLDVDTEITDWIPVTNDNLITVHNGVYINIAEIEIASNKVKFYESVKAVTLVEDPYVHNVEDPLFVSEFMGQTAMKVTYNLKAGKESTIYYAVYSKTEGLAGITNAQVLSGVKNAIETGSINATTTGGDNITVGLFSNYDLILGDYQVAFSTRVTAAEDFYGSPLVTTLNNTSFALDISSSGPSDVLPGSGLGGDDVIMTQILSSSGDRLFDYTKNTGDTDPADLKVLFIEQALIKNKKYFEIRNMLKSDLPGLVSANRAMEVTYISDELSQDVMDLLPGYYGAIIYNANSGNVVTYGDFSTNNDMTAFVRIKDGPVVVKTNPIFSGMADTVVFEFDNIVTPASGKTFFATGSESIGYKNGFITNPETDVVTWAVDTETLKTYATVVYSESQISLEENEEIVFKLNSTGFSTANSEVIASFTITGPITSIFDGVAFGRYQKTQSIGINNNRPLEISYILVDSTLVANVPNRQDLMSSFMSDYPGKTKKIIVNANSNGLVDLSSLDYGTYKVIAYPSNYYDLSYISPASLSAITLYQQTSTSTSSGSNDDEQEDLTPAQPSVIDLLNTNNAQVEKAGDDPAVNTELEAFNSVLDQIKTPEEAEKGMAIVGKTIGNVGEGISKLEKKDKEKLVDNLAKIIGNTEEILEKVASGADKVNMIEGIIKNTKKVMDELEKGQESIGKQKMISKLNSSLIDLANKVIEEESKIIIQQKKLITPEDIQKPLEKGKAVKEKLNTILKEAGVEQGANTLKSKVTIKVPTSKDGGSNQVGFRRDTIEALAKNVGSVHIDFGATGIEMDPNVMGKSKEDMIFTTEDLKGNPIKKPSGHEDEALMVRQVEAYQGDEKVKEFVKPVKVTFSVEDFGFDPKNKAELSNLIVMVQNELTGDWEPAGGVYNPITDEITFYRIHMSKYTVVKNKKKFSDVDNSWAKDEINNLLGKGIVDATSEFRPDASLTREEFAAWICRAYGLKESGHKESFVDIDPSNPYYDEITNACNQGLVFGRSEENFAPKETITREEMATLVARAIANYNDVKVPGDGASKFASLKDGTSTSTWAVDNVALVIDMGIMDADDDGNFNPQQPISKEAAADVFAKLYK